MIKYLLIYIERLHRFVFDILYMQKKLHYSLKEKVKLKWYKFLVSLCPTFRGELIYTLKLYDRAYKLRRLSFKRQLVYFKLLKINLNRYTPIK